MDKHTINLISESLPIRFKDFPSCSLVDYYRARLAALKLAVDNELQNAKLPEPEYYHKEPK